MAVKTRNSSIELLRLICIFGIIFMHTIAYAGDEMGEANRILLILANCFCNLGVTCFMLISGYFGITFNLQKLIKLDLMVIFYSLVRQGIIFALGGHVGAGSIVTSVFPIISNEYWYLSAYFFIAILSGFLNKIPEKLPESGFRRLLLILLGLFCVIPTFLYFDILGDGGKGVVQMTIVYLIGRYIRYYDPRRYKKARIVPILLCNILLTFGLEMALFAATGKYSMFYRDCSIFTVCSAVLLFTIFRNMKFESRFINRIASAVLAVYVFSFGFQRLVHLLLPLEDYAFSMKLFPLVFVFALLVTTGCLAIELLRMLLFGRLETRFAGSLAEIVRGIIRTGGGIGLKITEKVSGYITKQ